MATSHSIVEPFPDHIDREAFGHWLSGFCDGEATFCLSTARSPLSACGKTARAQFIVKLRDDDEAILRMIQSFLGCGTVHRHTRPRDPNSKRKPLMGFHVIKISDLIDVVLPHFHRFPLRAKKARDLVLWEKGARFIAEVSRRGRRTRPSFRGGLYAKWTPSDFDHFDCLIHDLRSIRKYPDSPYERPAKPSGTTQQNGHFGFLD